MPCTENLQHSKLDFVVLWNNLTSILSFNKSMNIAVNCDQRDIIVSYCQPSNIYDITSVKISCCIGERHDK